MNGFLELIEVKLCSCEERALSLFQLSFVHVVHVGGAAAACQHNGCSSWLEAGEVFQS